MINSDNVKILLVDDEKWTLSGIHIRFPDNYKIVWAKDCLTAIKKLKKYSFDLILMDIIMPEVGGIECADLIRQNNYNIPIIFLTAVNDTAACVQAFQHGAVDYVTKPIDFSYLLKRIDEVLRKVKKKNAR